MKRFYTYDLAPMSLTSAPKCATIDGEAVINPTCEQPTLDEFKAGLPQIKWSFAE